MGYTVGAPRETALPLQEAEGERAPVARCRVPAGEREPRSAISIISRRWQARTVHRGASSRTADNLKTNPGPAICGKAGLEVLTPRSDQDHDPI